MFGNMKDLAAIAQAVMSGDTTRLVDLARPHLPAILKLTVCGIIAAADGDPERDGAYLWHHKRDDGSDTIMATVYRRNDMGDPAEVIGTIDVLVVLDKMDLAKLMQ